MYYVNNRFLIHDVHTGYSLQKKVILLEYLYP